MILWKSVIGPLCVLLLLQVVAGTSNPCDNIMLQNRSVEPFPPFDKPTATVMRYRKQQSVNLGSWFVHESWMTPSIFKEASGQKVSELDIALGWSSPDCARNVLEDHWDRWITESDFSYLSSIGINTVRIPIGYWSLGPEFCQGTPFDPVADVYSNAWSFVVRGINMAGQAGIGVLVDLHGAVGSQNGQPHSGISDGKVCLFNTPANVEKTLAVLAFLTQQLCNVTNVVGIQLLNEPKDCPELVGFYDSAISRMRQIPGAEYFPLYIHDAFNLPKFSNFIANRADFVVQDHHSYFVFTEQDENKSASQHTKDIKTSISDSLAAASANQRGNLVVDEWSGALTRQSLSNEPDEVAARRDFCTAQLEAYSNYTAGWSFWAYKKEDCDQDLDWCFTAAVGRVLPSDFPSYPRNCHPPSSTGGLLDPRSHIDGLFLAPPSAAKQTTSRDRLAAIHYRRWRRDTANTTAKEQSSMQGYSDGFSTARFFYQCDGSQLGFRGQYIEDNIAALGPDVITPGTEPDYNEGFNHGLSDGEACGS